MKIQHDQRGDDKNIDVHLAGADKVEEAGRTIITPQKAEEISTRAVSAGSWRMPVTTEASVRSIAASPLGCTASE
jgi:hypothetical protein